MQFNWQEGRLMGGDREVVSGTAGSGKTARLLDLFRQEQARLLASCSPGGAVWITPTNRSRREIVRRILDGSLRACLAPNVLTFDTFAERLLRTSNSQIAPLSGVAQRMVARTVIDAAQEAGALSYFAPIARTSGFLDLFLGFLSDLKRNETWPEDFEAECRRRGGRPSDRELSRLYRDYQDRLNALSLYDAEGRFWSARETLAAGRRGAFGRLSLVIVDGFTDFTQPQYEILEHLSQSAERVIISLPLDNPRVRTDLFAKSAAALAEINHDGRARVACLPVPASSGKGFDASFRHIADHLFDNPRGTQPLACAEGLEIIEAAGPSGEARALAERIKKLLLEGAAPDQIVIAVRGVDQEADVLRETLCAAGIPNGGPSQIPFSRTPVARALLNVLQAELEDWPFDRLRALLRLNQFRPRWASYEEGGVQAALRLLRKWKLGSDRRRILHRLSNLAEGKTEDRVDAARALALLRDLSNGTERLRRSATFADWVDRLVGVCDELGISPDKERGGTAPADRDPELAERDAAHWERLKDVLYDAARTLSLLDENRELDLGDFVRRLKDILESQGFRAAEERPGEVLVLEASDLRNLDVPHLFLAGLSEASFPRTRPDDCLEADSERRRSMQKARGGAVPSSPQQDEMLLFYSIVTRARQSLTLSYPSVSSSGQPLFSSPYVTALRSLFAAESLRVTVLADLDPVPAHERTLTAADLRLVATEDVRAKRPALFRLLAETPDSAAAARGVLASAAMGAARFEVSGFGGYEGVLTRPANLRQVADIFHREYQFSPTQLESYAECPFRFLLSNVLGIKPLESAETGSDPRGRGLSLHGILKELHAPPSGTGRPPAALEGAQIAGLLKELSGRQFVPPDECTPFERAVLAVERRFAERFADWYAAQWDAYVAALAEGWDEPPAPRFVELPFGDVVRVRDEAPHPHTQPFATFGSGDELVRVRGQIDRIDVGRRGTTTVFSVIDYKTRFGQKFDLDAVRAGRVLQLGIYVAAIRQTRLLGSEPGVFQMLYWKLTGKGCETAQKGSRATKVMQQIDPKFVLDVEAALHDVLPRMAARIRAGEFPVHNADRDCAGHCDYGTVCRVSQIRSIEEERQKLWSLTLP